MACHTYVDNVFIKLFKEHSGNQTSLLQTSVQLIFSFDKTRAKIFVGLAVTLRKKLVIKEIKLFM